MRRELRPMLSLAIPVILADIGWISMGIVDTIMVGPLGPAAIGAVGTGSTIFMTLVVLGMGTLLALDTFVSQSFGAGRIDECHRWLFAGLQLAGVMSVVLMLVSAGVVTALPRFGFHPEVLAHIHPYLKALVWSTPPLLLYAVCRRYLQALHLARPVTIALITANLINAVGNWAFVYGHLGLPAFGSVGSAYATVIGRIYMAAFLFGVILWNERQRPSGLHDVPFALDVPRMWRIVKLGVPAALQFALEVGVFAAASALAARISPLAVAANQIVLNIVSFMFMVPFGIGTAAAVRVGHAVGRRDPHGVRAAGWVALGIAVAFMTATALLLVIAPGPLLDLFTREPSVIETGRRLLFICAFFQLFDAMQTVGTGALRGLGDTRTPVYWNVFGHWVLGLPLGYVLCFHRGWGVEGLWIGLSAGLIVIGAALVVTWHRRTATITL